MTATRYPPGPRSRIPIRQLFALSRSPLETLTEMTRQYGEIVYMNLGFQPLYILNHPDLIEDVLVTRPGNFTQGRALQRARRLLGTSLLTSEGEQHLRQRRLAQP